MACPQIVVFCLLGKQLSHFATFMSKTVRKLQLSTLYETIIYNCHMISVD